jgi:hypothetical protein
MRWLEHLYVTAAAASGKALARLKNYDQASGNYHLWVMIACALVVVACVSPSGEAQRHPQGTGRHSMRIHFTRTGGLAGLPLTATVDAEALPPEEARQLRALVDRANFFALPSVLAAPSRGADRFQYTIIVETLERQHTVEVAEAAAPETLQPLLRWLTDVARQARRH